MLLLRVNPVISMWPWVLYRGNAKPYPSGKDGRLCSEELPLLGISLSISLESDRSPPAAAACIGAAWRARLVSRDPCHAGLPNLLPLQAPAKTVVVRFSMLRLCSDRWSHVYACRHTRQIWAHPPGMGHVVSNLRLCHGVACVAVMVQWCHHGTHLTNMAQMAAYWPDLHQPQNTGSGHCTLSPGRHSNIAMIMLHATPACNISWVLGRRYACALGMWG